MKLINLSEAAVERELDTIFKHWDALESEREAFRAWAFALSAACDGESESAQELESEHRAIHQSLAEQLIRRATLSLELVSRRAFVEWLAGAVAPPRAA
jgi:hypothetical protein